MINIGHSPRLPKKDPDATGAIDDQASDFLYARERRQGWVLRFSLGTVILIWIYLILFSSVAYDISTTRTQYLPPSHADFPTLFFVSLFVTPVLSMTAILVFALIGVFRGYKDEDLNKIPVTAGAKAASGSE